MSYTMTTTWTSHKISTPELEVAAVLACKPLRDMAAAKIVLYYSSVSGNMQARKVAYELVDIAADDQAKEFVKGHSGKGLVIPCLFVDSVFKSGWEELAEANEHGEVQQLLGAA